MDSISGLCGHHNSLPVTLKYEDLGMSQLKNKNGAENQLVFRANNTHKEFGTGPVILFVVF